MAKFNLYQKLTVHSNSQDYPIFIGYNALTDPDFINSQLRGEQVLIVTNETIAPLYLEPLQDLLYKKNCNVAILKDGEAFKNQQSLFVIYDKLIHHHHHRDTTLIALGGGVIGDITGFAAATYQRGVNFLQIPTTLLAQVDASVGGKTAINHPQAKNMIGSFHQPSAVIIDLTTLTTLPLREFRAGLAEIIKYALLEGGDFFELLCLALQEGLASNRSDKLPTIISHCCKIKADFVQKDERELGCRALLNLGHTFAHALEACTKYKRWLHGEAVAIGLYCAALLSVQQGVLDEKNLIIIEQMLKLAALPSRIPKDIDLKLVRTLMSQDKKIKAKNLRFILMKSIGNCYIENKVLEASLQKVLHAAVEGVSVD